MLKVWALTIASCVIVEYLIMNLIHMCVCVYILYTHNIYQLKSLSGLTNESLLYLVYMTFAPHLFLTYLYQICKDE